LAFAHFSLILIADRVLRNAPEPNALTRAAIYTWHSSPIVFDCRYKKLIISGFVKGSNYANVESTRSLFKTTSSSARSVGTASANSERLDPIN
jgi:hypothetical protein